MGAASTIEWTEATWNPTVGCTKISLGCDHCYAERIVERFKGRGAFAVVRHSEDKLYAPLRWRRPRMVFVNSMSDLFHDQVPLAFVERVFSVMARTPQHTYQLLTKRHARMRALLSRPTFAATVASIVGGPITWPLANIWLGVSAETQQWAEIRVPALLDTPAVVRFVSAEPLLGPLNLTRWMRPAPDCGHVDPDGLCGHPGAGTPECFNGSDCPINPDTYEGLDWVIVGGESGPGARPMHQDWAADLVTQGETCCVPVFVKQLGTAWSRLAGDRGKGNDPQYWPAHLRVRQLPVVEDAPGVAR